jgi:hypothetical protein
VFTEGGVRLCRDVLDSAAGPQVGKGLSRASNYYLVEFGW